MVLPSALDYPHRYNISTHRQVYVYILSNFFIHRVHFFVPSSTSSASLWSVSAIRCSAISQSRQGFGRIVPQVIIWCPSLGVCNSLLFVWLFATALSISYISVAVTYGGYSHIKRSEGSASAAWKKLTRLWHTGLKEQSAAGRSSQRTAGCHEVHAAPGCERLVLERVTRSHIL